MKTFLLILFLTFSGSIFSQSYYFPPADFDTWDESELVCDSLVVQDLLNFLEEKNTKSFIILKEGKILMENYFGTFTRDSLWFWASAGKTVTSLLIGMAEENGDLSIDDKTSDYLGDWTTCDSIDQDKITIRHQLTMTAGLDETISFDCTDPSCLFCINEPGTRWFYHNSPYTLLQDVYQAATGESASAGFNVRIGSKIGAFGAFVPAFTSDNKIFWSKTRDMARFGLLVSANGNWNGTTVYGNSPYFQDMRNTSQNLNKSYGYLWWLNGKESFILPGLDLEFNGEIIPNAPEDMFAGLGAQDQKLYIVPSQDLVVVRMGQQAEDNVLALSTFDNELWEKINNLNCSIPSSVKNLRERVWEVFPNPTSNIIQVKGDADISQIILRNLYGEVVGENMGAELEVNKLSPGYYFLQIFGKEGRSQNAPLIIH